MDSTQVQPLRLGTRLEGFEISRVTDHDPDGYTYVGNEVATKKPVVIREYPPTAAQDLAALAKARHANLAVVLRTLEANNRAYLITEPIAGEALSELLQRENSAFDEGRLKSVLLPLADGLEAAHVAGVLHLDIQPDHIVIKPNGAPVLVGFGVGHKQTRNAGYSAIEQYNEEFRIGRWTDIYALGAVAYRLMSGQAPPPADQRQTKDEMKPSRDAGANKYHRSLLHAIDWALKVHPLERPQNLAQWKDALLGLREDLGAGAGAGATVPITATMIRKFSELRQKKKEPAAPKPSTPSKANVTPVPSQEPGLVERELEKQRLEKERAEREQAERVRAERERLERERAERERLERERAERERLERERAERERLERERAERERAELERAARERKEQEQLERERRDRERAERERAEHERAQRERAEHERHDRERAERERIERERLDRERKDREQEERDNLQRERAARERAEREQAELAAMQAQKAEREKAERDKADRERAEREKSARERAERAERERAELARMERDRAPAARATPRVEVPVVTVPLRAPQKSRPRPPPAPSGPSWLSAVGAVVVLVLTIGYWWYSDGRRAHPARPAPTPLERVAPTNPPPPISAPAPKPQPATPVETPEPPPQAAAKQTEPERETAREPETPRQPEREAGRQPERETAREPETVRQPEPEAATEEPLREPKASARTRAPEAPAGANTQKQLVSQLRKKLTGTWTQESIYSVIVPGDGCYAKISRSWNLRFGGTAEDGRALTGTYQTKVHAQSAERRECRQFDDQVTIDGALTARPVSGNTLQVESVPTRCGGDCDQIADVFNYRSLERRYRFNVSADGYLSFSEDEVDFELTNRRR